MPVSYIYEIFIYIYIYIKEEKVTGACFKVSLTLPSNKMVLCNMVNENNTSSSLEEQGGIKKMGHLSALEMHRWSNIMTIESFTFFFKENLIRISF